MNNIKTPEELLEFMSKNINYGYLGKNKHIYKPNDSNFNTDWYEEYILESKDDILKNLYGNCFDQVEFARDWFLNNHYEIKTIYEMVQLNYENNYPSHAFLAYKNDNYWYWFENADLNNRGIHKFKTFQELINYQYDKYLELLKTFNIKSSEINKIIMTEFSKPKKHIKASEYLNHVLNSNIVYPNKKIKNIIFDLNNVILKNKSISILKDLNINNQDINKLKKFFLNFEDLDLGKETIENKFIKCHFSQDIIKTYKDILVNYYKYRKINSDLINMITKLKENNYNIYVLSDTNKEASKYYKKNIKNIDGWIFSCDYHTLKKDGLLFDIMLDKFNLNPLECYFIDDDKNNIKVALNHSIKGYIFNEKDDIQNLYDDMRNNKINI